MLAVVLAVAFSLIAPAEAAAADAAAESVPAATSPAPSLRSRTDAQLGAMANGLEAQATSLGEALLAADARRDEIAGDRDVARDLLAAFLADSYKRASTSGSTAQQLVSSGSFAEAIDRIRIADAIGDYRANVLRSLDSAEARLDATQVDRARTITRLSGIQRRLVAVRAEQARREQIRATHAANRRAREQAAAAKAAREAREAAAQSAMLVAQAGAGAASFGVPFVPAGSPPTAQVIDAYLASKGSPMVGQGAAFMASGARWRLDPRLLVAIAGAESSFGQVTCGPNNAWGWACPNDPADFQTWAHGIDTVAEGLRRYYLDEGRTSVSLIQQKYCPVGAANDPTGLNSHWTANVTKFLVELGGNPATVGPGPSGPGALGIPGFGIFGD